MAFTLLPVEVNSHIASFLETDQDICNFSLICHETHGAVACDGSPLWRELFRKRFDLVPNVSNNAIRDAYKVRRTTLRRGANFQKGKSGMDECLKVLKALVLESFCSGCTSEDTAGQAISLNMQAIERFISSFDIIRLVKIPANLANLRSRAKNLLMMQLVLSSFQFDPKFQTQVLGFHDSQKAMYETAMKAPIFKDAGKDQVNISWVANAINFFKYHFTQPAALTLYEYYQNLPPDQKIKAWRKPLRDGISSLGRQWKGSYLYLTHPQMELVRGKNEEIIEDNFNEHQDENGEKGPFQTLNMTLSSQVVWPSVFERHLQSLSFPRAKARASAAPQNSTTASRTRAQTRAQKTPVSSIKPYATADLSTVGPLPFYFHCSGLDEEQFFACGWIQPLPPQQGFPGWRRITMMKFFAEVHEEDTIAALQADPFGMQAIQALHEQQIYDSVLWAYEGVMLPGDEIIVGRWWSIGADIEDHDSSEEPMYSGPFIFWCIDQSD